jgi:hypothetical protein
VLAGAKITRSNAGPRHRARTLKEAQHSLFNRCIHVLVYCVVRPTRSLKTSRKSLSRLPSSRMLSTVDGQDDDVFVGDAEVHSVWKPAQERSPRFSSHTPELHRVSGDPIDRFVQRCAELGAEPRPATFVPVSRFEGFCFGLGSKADPKTHS